MAVDRAVFLFHPGINRHYLLIWPVCYEHVFCKIEKKRDWYVKIVKILATKFIYLFIYLFNTFILKRNGKLVDLALNRYCYYNVVSSPILLFVEIYFVELQSYLPWTLLTARFGSFVKKWSRLVTLKKTCHNLKWDHFEILATGRSNLHCTIKEILFIRDLQPSLNEYVSSEKVSLY